MRLMRLAVARLALQARKRSYSNPGRTEIFFRSPFRAFEVFAVWSCAIGARIAHSARVWVTRVRPLNRLALPHVRCVPDAVAGAQHGATWRNNKISRLLRGKRKSLLMR